MNAIVVGAGIGGIATAIRLANKGYQVKVLEANNYPGGKLTTFEQDGFRFDAGPSLFTLPELVDEIIALQKGNAIDFPYKKLEESCRYFWDDNTRLTAYTNPEKFATEVEKVLGVPAWVITDYIKSAEYTYETSAKIFLEKSLHKTSTFLSKKVLKAIFNIYKFGVFETMAERNHKKLDHAKLEQLFNRFATYNGSSPYKAPGILTSIANLELNRGTFYPENGMHQITEKMVATAESLGVQFLYQTPVDEILVENNNAVGVKVNDEKIVADLVVSNMDVHPTYKKLLPREKSPEATLKQERSSSALIFYWGINRSFDELGLHNIFFSNNYQAEFDHIFNKKSIYHDPTIYVNITSKETPKDAPEGMENWFVMVNVPANDGSQDWQEAIEKAKEAVLMKLRPLLKANIEDHIITENILDPISIEQKTSSYQGSLYGASSNNKYAAFLRHPNFSQNIKNLYFTGGSVHPGGGIPLCLLSAKIIDELTPSVKH